MKKFLAVALLMFASCSVSMAWNCTVAGEGRVQVPASYTGNGVGDGNNQVVSQGGLNFACLPDPIPTPAPTAGNTNTNTNNNTSTSTSGSTSTATGGNATATGGNSTSNQTQGQKQGQSQSSNNQSAGGSVSNVGNSVENIAAPKIPVATADAPPVFSTANCFKGFSGGAQSAAAGISFGGGGIDKNCAAERIAQDYYAMGNRLAACKVITNTKASKDAGVTLQDCLNVPVRPIVTVPAPALVMQPEPQITVNVPPSTTEVYYISIPHETITVTPAPKPAPVHAARKKIEQPKPCYVIQDQCVVVGHKVTGEK
jgi:hypothetical protein